MASDSGDSTTSSGLSDASEEEMRLPYSDHVDGLHDATGKASMIKTMAKMKLVHRTNRPAQCLDTDQLQKLNAAHKSCSVLEQAMRANGIADGVGKARQDRLGAPMRHADLAGELKQALQDITDSTSRNTFGELLDSLNDLRMDLTHVDLGPNLREDHITLIRDTFPDGQDAVNRNDKLALIDLLDVAFYQDKGRILNHVLESSNNTLVEQRRLLNAVSNGGAVEPSGSGHVANEEAQRGSTAPHAADEGKLDIPVFAKTRAQSQTLQEASTSTPRLRKAHDAPRANLRDPQKPKQQQLDYTGTQLIVPRNEWPEWVPSKGEIEVPHFRAVVTGRATTAGAGWFISVYSVHAVKTDLEPCEPITTEKVKLWSKGVQPMTPEEYKYSINCKNTKPVK